MKKKQTTPKPTKKASKAPVNLIEGKYSHKFLTRLKPEIGEKLTVLMTGYKEKTCNGAIVRLIEQIDYLVIENKKLSNSLDELQNKHYTITNRVDEFTIAFHQLFDNKLVKENDNTNRTKQNRCSECNNILDSNNYCDNCDDYMD